MARSWRMAMVIVIGGLCWLVAVSGGVEAAAASEASGVLRDNARGFLQQQRENQVNLIWLVQGLRDMDKDTPLRLTKDQARKMLPIYEKWIQDGVLRIDAPEPRREGMSERAQQPQIRQRQGEMPADPGQQRQRMAELQARQEALARDIDTMDSYLTGAQLRFVDNLKFDPAIYGLGGGDQGVWFSQGERPNPAALQRLRRQMQDGQAKLVALCKEVYELLKQRAK